MEKNKGITLIALIITIIIMLILVAVSVNVLIKSNLIGTAEKTVDKYKTASEEEADDGTIIINGKRYTSMAEYAEILDNGGSRIKFNHTVEGRTIKLNVKVIEQSYVDFAEKKLQNKSNKDKIKILSQGLEFWNGYGQVPYKNADEMLNDSPFDSWEQAINDMQENFDQLLINFGLVYPESYFNEDNNYVVFANKKLQSAKDDAEKQKLFLDGENYYRKGNGEEPYKDLTELLTEWNYESVEKLVEGEGYENLDSMLMVGRFITPEKISEIEENNILALTLPNGEIETTPDNEYYTEYNANNVDIANYTFIAKKGQEENTLTVKMAVANLPGGTRVTKTTEYKYRDETAIIPAGFTVSGIGNEGTIDGGLVIYDIPEGTTVDWTNPDSVKTAYNQFVWIPVEVTSSDTETNIAAFKRSEWTSNERTTGLESTYTEPYSNTTDDYDASTGIKTQIENLTKSIYKYGGFYIGRYEAGSKTPRTSSSGVTEIGIKQDMYPYNNVKWGDSMSEIGTTGAVYLSNSLYNTNEYGATSMLCTGACWDSMLDFIKNSDHSVTYSPTWGNYRNSETFEITRGAYAVYNNGVLGSFNNVGNKYSKTKDTEILLTTGATERNSSKNIYDVAGNCWEWTTESNSSSKRVYRGRLLQQLWF